MNSESQNKLKKLYLSYLHNLPEKINTVQDLLTPLLKHWKKEPWADLHRIVHNLIGSAGTYGFPKVSQTARQLEILLKNNLTTQPTRDEQVKIIHALQILRDTAQHCKIPEQIESFIGKKPVIQDKNQLIYFFENDTLFARETAKQLKQLGYEVKVFSQSDDFLKSLTQTRPGLMLIDLQSLDDESKKLLTSYKVESPITPMLVLSADNDLHDQLEAVRLGSDAYFTKPIEINALANEINLFFETILDPYRILIVEDSKEMADYFSHILCEAGMKVEVINDPTTIYKTLTKFSPELILMDIYMPKISGIELAAVIRQQAAYNTVPIVFLSSEKNPEKQLQALSLGGDDFITKPVAPAYLIGSVKIRAERYRFLRNLMLKDGLTGLFNHSTIQTKLEVELVRNQRENSHLVFAMLDIDHFKKINDTFGHQVGDQVLRTLSLFLLKRLRRSDIIGRYGGEEFAIILPNTEFQAAVKVFDDLRISFSQLVHHSGKEFFSVTLSGGLAFSPPYFTSSQIIEAADQALYQAKETGRNQILINHDFSIN